MARAPILAKSGLFLGIAVYGGILVTASPTRAGVALAVSGCVKSHAELLVEYQTATHEDEEAISAYARTNKNPPSDVKINHVTGNYPIERYFPKVSVKPGHVPTETEAFHVWRNHTPEEIPDTAFNAHYYTVDEWKIEWATAGKGIQFRSASEHSATEGVSPILREFSERQGTFLTIPRISADPHDPNGAVTLAKAHFGSVENMLKQAKVESLELTPAKFQRLLSEPGTQGRYIILKDGRIGFVFDDEAKRIEDTIKKISEKFPFSHFQMLDLLAADSTQPTVEIIDQGILNYQSEATPALSRSLRELYLKGKEAKVPFDSLAYILTKKP